MLKLRGVLCAATFFGLAIMVAGEFEGIRQSIVNHIAFVRDCIERRIGLIRQMIEHTTSLSTNEFVEEVAELKQNMTNELKLIRLLVNDIIDDPNVNSTVNKTKCRSYYVEYEENERDVEKNLNQQINIAKNATLTRLEKMLNGTLEEVEKLKKLEKQGRQCRKIDCYGLRSRANSIRSQVFFLTLQFPCSYKGPSTALEAILQMAFDLFIEKGQIVMEKTVQCAFNGHPPHFPHGHHH